MTTAPDTAEDVVITDWVFKSIHQIDPHIQPNAFLGPIVLAVVNVTKQDNPDETAFLGVFFSPRAELSVPVALHFLRSLDEGERPIWEWRTDGPEGEKHETAQPYAQDMVNKIVREIGTDLLESDALQDARSASRTLMDFFDL